MLIVVARFMFPPFSFSYNN